MSDFVTNLARRALGDTPRAGVSPSQGAVLASQLALPIATAPAPAPPAIGTVPSSAPAPVMRQAAPPAAAPPAPQAVAAPRPPAVPQPADALANLSAARPQPELASSPETKPVESPRRPAEPNVADAVELTAPSRMPVERFLDTPRGEKVDGASHLADTREPAPTVASIPRSESTAATIRIEPADGRPDVERGPRPRVEPPLVKPLTLQIPALQPDQHPAVPSSPIPAEPALEPELLERVPIAPRLEKPQPAPAASHLSEPPSDGRERTAAPVQRRPVEIRIGAIDVRITPPEPGVPAERPGLAGFEEYAGLRQSVHFSDD